MCEVFVPDQTQTPFERLRASIYRRKPVRIVALRAPAIPVALALQRVAAALPAVAVGRATG